MAEETGWLSSSEIAELQRLGWDVHKPRERPPAIPEEELFPVAEELDHLLVDPKQAR